MFQNIFIHCFQNEKNQYAKKELLWCCATKGIKVSQLVDVEYMLTQNVKEQQKIGEYFSNLDHLITLHQQKYFYHIYTFNQTKNSNKRKKENENARIGENNRKKVNRAIDLWRVSVDFNREDLKTEDDLWKNFKYILEQNNKDRLNGEALSDAEFEQVKNQLQFSSFYKAGEWLVGENGKVMVHVQRDTERLHLVVMNHEHIAGEAVFMR